MELGVSYIAAHDPNHIENDMKQIREIGCTEVLFALQENHLVYLNGALRYGAGIAKENGLKPYALIWGYANSFGGGRISKVMLDNLDMWRIDKGGNYVQNGCLNNPKLVDKFIEYTDMCRANGFEGTFVDEPTLQECFCEHCVKRFSEMFGKDLKTSEGTDEYEVFRRDTVRHYTDYLCKRVKALDPNQKTMACVMPHDRECFEAVASIPELDIFGTDPYWLLPGNKMTLEDAIRDTQLTKDICQEKGKTSQIWLNCWCIRMKVGDEDQIYTGGKKLAEVGCDSMYAWAFRGAIGTNEECARPDVAWGYLSKLYRELSGI